MKMILALCLALLSTSALAANLPQRPHVTVSGESTVQVVPDILTLHVSVQKTGKQIASTKQVVDQHAAAAIAVAKKLGISEHDITSTQLYIRPQYDEEDDKRVLTGYEVRRQLTLKLRDLNKYEALLKGLVKAGITGVGQISRSYSHPEQLRDEAFAKAIKDAYDKAKRLAHGFHARLGHVYSVSVQQAPEPRPMMHKAVRFMAAAQSSAFEPGTVNVRARIRVVFLLKP